MEKLVQIDNVHRIKAYLALKKTQMADAVCQNLVAQYTRTDRLSA